MQIKSNQIYYLYEHKLKQISDRLVLLLLEIDEDKLKLSDSM